MKLPSIRTLHAEGLEPYLSALAGITPPDEAGAARLFAAAAQGDAAARERIVLSHLPLVVRIACGYVGYGLPLADLISEGNLGLLRAAELFNPAFGVPFATYAGVWIKQRIHRAITAQAKVVRIPVWRSQRLRKLDRLHRDLEQELGRDATLGDLAERIGLREEDVAQIAQERLEVESIDAPETFREPADPAATPGEALSRGELLEEVIACLHGLDDMELHILSLKYGLAGHHPPQSYRAMAERFGKSREWIRRIGERAMAKVAASLHAAGELPRSLIRARRERARERLAALPGKETSGRVPSRLPLSPMMLMEILEPTILIPCF